MNKRNATLLEYYRIHTGPVIFNIKKPEPETTR